MLFKDILGLSHIKSHLVKSVENGRIPHAQLFVGPEGSGTLPMAIAYAQYLLCSNTNGENNTGNDNCNLKFNNFSHPDLHFAFPVTTTDAVKRHPVSANFLKEWRELLTKQPYGNLFDWYRILGVDNKQGQIGVDEALDISKSLALKSYEGGYKIMLIWMAEKLNTQASNKLLKLIEEPPNKTVFILVAEEEEQIINTIRSRCQVLHFPPLTEDDIKNGLIKQYNLPQSEAEKIARQADGNYNKACDLVYQDSEDIQFETWFIAWIRSAFKAKGNKSSILDLMTWAEEIAKTGRETQKLFLHFCIDFFRQALLLNYGTEDLVFIETKTKGFELAKFAPFVHNNNILDITETLQDAIYHIERNGNSKIILTDLSIKLTRLLHTKTRLIMEYLYLNVTEIILLLFLVITFLQSGIDKIIDWNGNIAWLKGHFKDTFLGKMVPLNVGIILVIEMLAGLFCLVGIIEIIAYGTKYYAVLGVILSCITLLLLLFGQRIAKDYEGAKTIAVYFIPAIFALYILTA